MLLVKEILSLKLLILAQSQKQKHQNKASDMLKTNNKDTITMSIK